MDKFSAMQAFVRVVEAGTFTKAADSMGMGIKAFMSRSEAGAWRCKPNIWKKAGLA